jgi:hypothetical protein
MICCCSLLKNGTPVTHIVLYGTIRAKRVNFANATDHNRWVDKVAWLGPYPLEAKLPGVIICPE